MKQCKRSIALLLAAVCALLCLACCLPVFAEGSEPPAHVHDYVAEITIAPTCTEPGLRRYVCACGAVDTARDEEIPATGHRWSAWTTVTEATTEQEGLKERTCLNNPEHKEYKTVPKEEPSRFSVFFQNLLARFKALYDRIISLFYRD